MSIFSHRSNIFYKLFMVNYTKAHLLHLRNRQSIMLCSLHSRTRAESRSRSSPTSALSKEEKQEKEAYLENNGTLQAGRKKKSLSPEEISVFYRNFLNENRTVHSDYNKEWYKRNFMLLWPALKVAVIRLGRRVRRKRSEDSR